MFFQCSEILQNYKEYLYLYLMRLHLLLFAITFISVAASTAIATDSPTMEFIKKCQNSTYIKNNADKIASFLPTIKSQLKAYLKKHQITLSDIAKRIIKLVSEFNGDYDQLSDKIQIAGEALWKIDFTGSIKMAASIKKALGVVNP